jgi:hypothetical protein
MTWAAMDVHARSTYAASMDVITGELSCQRFDTGAVEPVVGWLAGLPAPVRCCYEAGPTGFGLYRAAVASGIDCQVIAPSKTPRPSGDRNKSDRRDTDLLLRQLMAGALTPVAVPSPTCEAARDLARAREAFRQKQEGAPHTKVEVSIEGPNGRRVRIAVNSVPLKNADGAHALKLTKERS